MPWPGYAQPVSSQDNDIKSKPKIMLQKESFRPKTQEYNLHIELKLKSKTTPKDLVNLPLWIIDSHSIIIFNQHRENTRAPIFFIRKRNKLKIK